MNLVNLTGKRIRIYDHGGEGRQVIETIEPAHGIKTPYIAVSQTENGSTIGPGGDMVPVFKTMPEIKDPPPPLMDALFIVPFEVAQVLRQRTDLLSVNGGMGSTVRDKGGKIIGYTSLQTYG